MWAEARQGDQRSSHAQRARRGQPHPHGHHRRRDRHRYDDDPTLRAAALALGRGYLAVDLNAIDAPPDRPADLVVLRWPRPGDHSWLSTAGEVFAGVRELFASMGHVAVLLDPTPALAYGITWTGTLLAAATGSGLPALQDIVCVHDMEADGAGQSEAPGSVTLRHRVILVLGSARARHVAH